MGEPAAPALVAMVAEGGQKPLLVLLGGPSCAACVDDLRAIATLPGSRSAPVRTAVAWPGELLGEASSSDPSIMERVWPVTGARADEVLAWASAGTLAAAPPATVVVGSDGNVAAVHEGPLTAAAVDALLDAARATVPWLEPNLPSMEVPVDLVAPVAGVDPRTAVGSTLASYREARDAQVAWWSTDAHDDYDLLVDRVSDCGGNDGSFSCHTTSTRAVVSVRDGAVVAGSAVDHASSHPDADPRWVDLRHFTMPAILRGDHVPHHGQGEVWVCDLGAEPGPSWCSQSPMRASLPTDSIEVVGIAPR